MIIFKDSLSRRIGRNSNLQKLNYKQMKVAVIKYNAGNIMSVDYALQRLGINAIVTDNHEYIMSADKVIFPGVGEASTTMANLKSTGLSELIPSLKQPVLGICLGLQLMCSYSEEGNTKCLGIFEEKVQKFLPVVMNNTRLKVPHMGWNSIYNINNEIFKDINEGDYTYFVHSYYATIGEHTIAECNHTLPFSAALRKNNYFATQFHPEKSGEIGAQILKNFIAL